MRGTRAPPILPIYAHLPSVLNSTTAAGQCHRHACPTAIGARRYHHDHHGLIEKYKDNPTKHWDKFYKRHQSKFFKDRHYLEKDWGQCFADDVNENGKVVLEVGCGAGNTIFPLLAAYPKIYVHACDFSPHAISLVKSHVDFREDRVNAFICDVTDINLCETISPSSVDVVTLFLRRKCL